MGLDAGVLRRGKPSWTGLAPLWKEHESLLACFLFCTMWGRLCTRKSPPQTSDLLGPWSWTSLPPELWEINFWYLSYPVSCIFSYSKVNSSRPSSKGNWTHLFNIATEDQTPISSRAAPSSVLRHRKAPSRKRRWLKGKYKEIGVLRIQGRWQLSPSSQRVG